VLDPNAAAVVEATVTAKNVDTGIETIVQTNSEGLYHFSNLEPGNYKFSVSKRGFKVIVKPAVMLHVVDTVSMNFTMQVGDLKETVMVEGGAPMINTTDASVSTVVDQTYVKNMPLNGRSFQDLILLTPGILTNSPQPQNVRGLGQSGEFSVNGQRTESNYYTVDGVSANVGTTVGRAQLLGAAPSGSLAASTALGTTQALVSVDDLEEFRVQSSSYSAEYGRNPGGQFSFQTKSGTNQFHGTAYDYLRNDVFDATDYFTNYFRSTNPLLRKTALRQNDFGGTLGGPVRVPGLYNGRDKTFFFVSYEGLRLVAPQPATPSFVPDLCMRGVVAQCPSGRQPAASALQPVMNAFPLPSPNGLTDAANGFGQFIGTWSNPSALDSTSIRFDHVVNDKLRLFFRFSDTGSSAAVRATPPNVATMVDTQAYALRTYTAGANVLFSSRLSNEFRFNYASNEVKDVVAIGAFAGNSPVNLAQLAGLDAAARVDVALIYNGYNLTFSQTQQSGSQRQWNLADTVNFSLGRHQLKAGVDYRRLAPFSVPVNPRAGFFYRGEPSVEANNASLVVQREDPAYPLYTNLSAFAQDEWRISQRLSLSVGMRWEVNPPPGVTQGLKPYTLQGSDPNALALAPQGTALWHTTWYNFAPRLGAAYVLHNATGWLTVVRGGGGVFFDTGQQMGSESFVGPGFVAFTSKSGSFPGPVVLPTVVNPPVAPYNTTPYGFAQHLQLPYTVQWNTSIEQALGSSQALTVSYVGSHASRLLKQDDFFPANNPNASFFILFNNGLTSDYHSLQGQFRRRFSAGLTALASYTWAHCLDYGSQNGAFGYQRGNCDFDVRHNLSTAFSYDIPKIGHDRFARAVLDHWGLDDRFTAHTAFPVTLNGNVLLLPNAQQYLAGLNLVPGQPVYLYGANCAFVLQGLNDLKPGQGCPGGRAINPQAFSNVSTGLGNAPRNFARGFGAWQMDLAIRRDFPIRERLKLQFRAEAFNVFNHPNFGSINANCGGTPGVPGCTNRLFGQATGTLANSLGVLNPLYQMGGPRSMQFALKIVF
jgi:hypothetical protein